MKKSKIIGITLGCIGIATVGITTPLIATSCSSKEESVKANFELIKPDALKLGPAKPNGLELVRIQDTNKFNLYSDQNQWDGTELEHLVFSYDRSDMPNGFFDWVSKERLEQLGFNKDLLNQPGLMDQTSGKGISISVGMKNINGNIFYPGLEIEATNKLKKVFEKADKSKGYELFKTFKVFQLDNAKFQKLQKELEQKLQNQFPTQEEFNKLTPEQQKEIISKVAQEYSKISEASIEKQEVFDFSLTINPKKAN